MKREYFSYPNFISVEFTGGGLGAIAPIPKDFFDFFQQERFKNEPILSQTELKTPFLNEITLIHENPRSATKFHSISPTIYVTADQEKISTARSKTSMSAEKILLSVDLLF